jgi:hypothetical protein
VFASFQSIPLAPLHQAIDARVFDSSQVVYNMLNPSAATALPANYPAQDYGRPFDRTKAAIISGLYPLQTAPETLAQKAIAAGFIGEQVDGNDVMAVRAAAEDAICSARKGQGPRLIEAVTRLFRQGISRRGIAGRVGNH